MRACDDGDRGPGQIKRQGLAGLYTGIWANFLLCLNPAIKHCVFDQVFVSASSHEPVCALGALTWLSSTCFDVMSACCDVPATACSLLPFTSKMCLGVLPSVDACTHIDVSTHAESTLKPCRPKRDSSFWLAAGNDCLPCRFFLLRVFFVE